MLFRSENIILGEERDPTLDDWGRQLTGAAEYFDFWGGRDSKPKSPPTAQHPPETEPADCRLREPGESLAASLRTRRQLLKKSLAEANGSASSLRRSTTTSGRLYYVGPYVPSNHSRRARSNCQDACGPPV